MLKSTYILTQNDIKKSWSVQVYVSIATWAKGNKQSLFWTSILLGAPYLKVIQGISWSIGVNLIISQYITGGASQPIGLWFSTLNKEPVFLPMTLLLKVYLISIVSATREKNKLNLFQNEM